MYAKLIFNNWLYYTANWQLFEKSKEALLRTTYLPQCSAWFDTYLVLCWIFPKIDVDLFALVTRPVVDTIAQEMILQKKLSIEECTDRCVNFLLKGFLGSK